MVWLLLNFQNGRLQQIPLHEERRRYGQEFSREYQKNGNKSLAFQLFDDFDASSACELINLLDESVAKSTKVAIDTDGLRNVNRFGLEVFLPRITQLNNTRVDIEVTGRFRGVFQDE